MHWRVYRLVYASRSNLLVGWHTLGYVNLTRYYIPGKNIWASFTDNLARSKKDEKGRDGHITYGNRLKEDVRFSYFYPSADGETAMPRYTAAGLCYGSLSAAEFEKRFIRSFGKTAIAPEKNAKLDESLHEMEFIAPISLSFIGFVLIKTGVAQPVINGDMLDALFGQIFVGGERKYGWGRLELREKKEITDGKMFDFDIDVSKPINPELTLHKNAYLPAHVPVKDNMKIGGNIETLVGRDWGVVGEGSDRKIGAGRKISDAKLCWAPGSQFMGDDEIKLRFGTYGILEVC